MQGLVRFGAFLVATVSGSLLAVIVLQYREILETTVHLATPASYALPSSGYRSWLSDQGLERIPLQYGVNEAHVLYERVPVLCLIHATSTQQARAALNTWSRRCNRAVFFGTFSDPYVPIERVSDSCSLLRRVVRAHGGSFRWLLLVDDETFAVVENLRFYVAPLNASAVHYLGHPVRGAPFHNALAAGVALSEGAVRALLPPRDRSVRCRNGDHQPSIAELDKYIGALLRRGGRPVEPVDTRDPLRRGRFNPLGVEKMLVPGSVPYSDPYWRTSLFRSPEGGRCCSRRAVTFHGVNPVDMFLLEYLVYGLRVGSSREGSRASPTSSPPALAPMELTSLLRGKAFIKPYGIGGTT
ncbi:glycoprotein-N-acetylgalactosamine 3-beta-galactosyltransferase 1-like [Amblyomma americanum]